MKVVILAGGFGTRISEESLVRPKPMIEIGGRPILWHIMKSYSHYGFNDFVICLGYKGYFIKEYFAHYFLHESDVTFDFHSDNHTEVHHHSAEPWRVTLVNTGLHTMTGGRIRRIHEYVKDETFLLTYGDGVADVNIRSLVDYHTLHGRAVTVTSVQPEGRFGSLNIDANDEVTGFYEKPLGDGSWINAGFFVAQSKIFDYLAGDDMVFEREPLERLARDGELMAYKHTGFWHAMDTVRDKSILENLWASGKAPWKVWVNGSDLVE